MYVLITAHYVSATSQLSHTRSLRGIKLQPPKTLQQASLWTNKICWMEHMQSILKRTYDMFSTFTCYTDAHIKNAYSFLKIRSAYLHVFPVSQNLWFLAARTLGDHLWHTALAVSSAVPPTCSESESLLTILKLSTQQGLEADQ